VPLRIYSLASLIDWLDCLPEDLVDDFRVVEKSGIMSGPGIVREKGKLRENVFLHVISFLKYCSWHNICKFFTR